MTPGNAQSMTESTPITCRVEIQFLAGKTHHQHAERGHKNALPDRKQNPEPKERAASRPFPGRFRARDEGKDGVVETEHPDFAQDIGRCPGDEEGAEGRGAEQARNEKSKDAAKIRGQERDRVEEHSALQFRVRAIRPGAQFRGRKFGC